MKKNLILSLFVFIQSIYCTENIIKQKNESREAFIKLLENSNSENSLDPYFEKFILDTLEKNDQEIENQNYKKGYESFIKWAKEHEQELTPKLISYILTILAHDISGHLYSCEESCWDLPDYELFHNHEIMPYEKHHKTAIEFLKLVEIYAGYSFKFISDHIGGDFNPYHTLLANNAQNRIIKAAYHKMYTDLYDWARQNDRLGVNNE